MCFPPKLKSNNPLTWQQNRLAKFPNFQSTLQWGGGSCLVMEKEHFVLFFQSCSATQFNCAQ